MGGLGYLDRRVGASDGIHSPMTAASTQLPRRAAEGEELPTGSRTAGDKANRKVGNSTFHTKETHLLSPVYNTPAFFLPTSRVRDVAPGWARPKDKSYNKTIPTV